MTSRREAILAGAQAVSPILLGIVPFGTITGAATVGAGIGTASAVGMSMLVFAGASQLAAVELIANNASVLVILATVLIVNLRFTMYSASMAPYFAELPLAWKGPLAYLLSDQAYAVSVVRFERDVTGSCRLWFYVGAALALWITWQLAFAVGALAGSRVPPSWSLDFAVPLTLLALLPATVRDASALVAVGATAVAASLSTGLPLNLGVIVSVLAGVAGGLVAEWGGRR